MNPARRRHRPRRLGHDLEGQLRTGTDPFPQGRLRELMADRQIDPVHVAAIARQAAETAFVELRAGEFHSLAGYRRALLLAARRQMHQLLGDPLGSTFAEQVALEREPPFPFGVLMVWLRNHAPDVAPGRRRPLAEEATSEAYVRAQQRYFRDELHYRRTLVVIGRNYLIDVLRKEGEIRLLGLELDDEIPDDPSDSERETLLDRVAGLLHRLPPESRRLVDLWSEGLGDQEIRVVLFPDQPGESGDAVYQTVRRAVRKALKDLCRLAAQAREEDPDWAGPARS